MTTKQTHEMTHPAVVIGDEVAAALEYAAMTQDKIILALAAEVRRLHAAGWRPINTLPESGDVLWTDGRFVFADPAECILGAHREGGATHWMPLPSAPRAA